ncbi:hypothetical protein [Ramlibacter albus]|uniref:Uncharacterized protein n=1 Tax=Ramlibacter albus TaxID=2079448 RepID=A0A923MCP4_9BURK|nr:hypothetical protein [Ramlibacter albus]MBC5766993.1 hypothetical protein [Ramlibacter albus]
MKGIRAELKGCRHLAADERARLEADVVERIARELGSRSPDAGAAYAQWLQLQSKPGMSIEELTACMRWESARDRAVCQALVGVEGDAGSEPFFVFHLG